MGFYVRKSIKFGPVRFNISKSGVGMSFGATGARITTGPRGTYVHLGRKGIYYRQKLDGSISYSRAKSGFANKRESVKDTRTSSIHNQFVSSSSDITVSQINERIQQPTCAGTMLVVSILAELCILAVLTGLQASLFRNVLIFGAIVGWILLMTLTWATNEQEKLARTTTLQYKLDEEANREYSDFLEALRGLSRSERIWRITDTFATSDWKRNAGATALVNRSLVDVSLATPPFIETNVEVYRLTLGNVQLFFLPDQILVFQNREYRSISYATLKLDYGPVTFREIGFVPTDAEVVDHTWRYVRKDGGPDMRFSGNHRVPIVLYWLVELYLSSDIRARLHVSNSAYGQRFSYGLSNYILYQQITKAASSKKTSSSSAKSSSHSSSRTQDRTRKTSDAGQASQSQRQRQDKRYQETRKETSDTDAYTVLNVAHDAPWEDVAAAYRKLVKMYHPDKVAGLAPEYRVIAEKKMKEINAAYSELKRHHQR